MPYKYVVDVDSKGFNEAPDPILRALHRLTWAGEQAVTDGTFRKFNELLTVGYFEDQKMGVSCRGVAPRPGISLLQLTIYSIMMMERKVLGPPSPPYL